MAKDTKLLLPKVANNGSVSFTSADTTTSKTVFTAGSDDSNLKALIATTDDTTAINMKIFVTRSGTDYLIGTTNIPIASGSNGSALAVDLLGGIPGLAVDSVGKRYLYLKNGDTIKVACLATMTAAKTCYVSAFGEDY